MSIHLYHPTKSVKGFACSFWYSDRDGSLFATLIKQSGWDDKNQNGIFKGSLDDPNKKVNIKLSDVEACAILDCIERNRPFSTFHAFDEAPKAISFVPWMNQPIADDDGNRPAPTQQGFSFSISVTNPKDAANKNSFYIGLKYAEARLVREFLIYYLHNSFDKHRTKKLPDEVSAPTEGTVNNSGETPSNPADLI